ncbi:MAG: hypothetical protein Q7T55_08565 [Solirubrobacteraceae bacterium]|nr:hypothetical protein [Solirubrobacteraceae bacterium]
MQVVDHLTPYRRLVELAETECALLQAGHLDEVEVLQFEWADLMGTLPAVPPRDAGDLLRRAVALSAQAQQDYRSVMADLQREMGEAGRTRAVGRAYGGGSYGGSAYAAPGAAGRIDTAA